MIVYLISLAPYCNFNNFNYKTNLKREDFKTMYYPEIRGGTYGRSSSVCNRFL